MNPERAADKEKSALFRTATFFLSDLKLGMTSLLITLSIAQLSENLKPARGSEKGSLQRILRFFVGTSGLSRRHSRTISPLKCSNFPSTPLLAEEMSHGSPSGCDSATQLADLTSVG
jgi:hypothetical protein